MPATTASVRSFAFLKKNRNIISRSVCCRSRVGPEKASHCFVAHEEHEEEGGDDGQAQTQVRIRQPDTDHHLN